MASFNGKILTCDRCGKIVVLKELQEGITDGGYTRYRRFENNPTEWARIMFTTSRSISYEICNKCAEEFADLLRLFVQEKNERSADDETR